MGDKISHKKYFMTFNFDFQNCWIYCIKLLLDRSNRVFQILRQVSVKLSQCLAELMLAENTTTGQAQALFSQALNWELPDTPTVLALVRLVWAASSANLHAFNASQVIEKRQFVIFY